MLVVVATVVVAASILGVVAYFPIAHSTYLERLTRMESDVRLLSDRARQSVAETAADVKLLAELPGVAQVTGNAPAADVDDAKRRLNRAFEALMRAKPEYVQVRLIGLADGGREVVRVDRTVAQGVVRSIAPDDLQTKGERPYFAEAIRTPPGGVYYSRIELNRELGTIQVPHVPVLRVATPVLTPGGELFGIAIINVDMAPTFERLRAAASGYAQVYLVNHEGDFLVHPDRSREFGFDLDRPARIGDELPALSDLARERDAGPLVRELTDRAGQQVVAASANVHLGGDVDLTVVLTSYRSSVLAAADRLLLFVIIASAAAILISAGLALVLARSIVRPLAQATAVVDRIDRGEAAELPSGAPVEIDTLVSALRRHAERERLFSAVVESTGEAILTKTRDGTITAWNAAAVLLYGYAVEEAVGRPSRVLVPQDRVAEFETIQRQVFEEEATVELESARMTKDGRRIDVALTVSPVRSLTGKIIGASEISHDITERKRSDALFRLAVDASPAALIMTDGSGRILLANRETTAMFGYQPDELVGKDVEVLLPERNVTTHPAMRDEFLRQPAKRMMGVGRDLYARHADGSEFPVEVGLNPMTTPEGPLILSAVVDISARKQAEREIERQTRDLQRSNAELQQFAYITSHDLQEPLRMVSSFCELLKSQYGDKLDNEANEFIDFAVDGARRMRMMISDLLEYSRLQSREMLITSVSAKTVLEAALRNLSIVIDEAEAEVTSGTLPTVSGNEGQLVHLFQNLIGNAIKFHGTERPRVHVEATRVGDEWRFSVRDNGIGIDPKQHDAIFGVFQRLHTRDEYPGTGIGLAICKRIVERHGGRIWVESTPRRGATFYFTLMSSTDVDHDNGKPRGDAAEAVPQGRVGASR